MPNRSRWTIGRAMIWIVVVALILAFAKATYPAFVAGLVLDVAILAAMGLLVRKWWKRHVGDRADHWRPILAWGAFLLNVGCVTSYVYLLTERSLLSFYRPATRVALALTCTVGAFAFVMAMTALTILPRTKRQRLALWHLAAVLVGVTSATHVMLVGFLWLDVAMLIVQNWNK